MAGKEAHLGNIAHEEALSQRRAHTALDQVTDQLADSQAVIGSQGMQQGHSMKLHHAVRAMLRFLDLICPALHNF